MGSRQNKHGKGTENYQNVARVQLTGNNLLFFRVIWIQSLALPG